jgi:hypothetical protein
MKIPMLWTAILAVVAAALLPGCAAGGSHPDHRDLTAADFVGHPSAAATPPAASPIERPASQPALSYSANSSKTAPSPSAARPAASPVERPASQPAPSYIATPSEAAPSPAAAPARTPSVAQAPVVAAPTTAPAPIMTHAVDAMIGEVNGQPIYASRIFETEGIGDTLARLGREPRISRDELEWRAHDLIEPNVRELIKWTLVLGEAERDLNEQERSRVQELVRRKREELVRQWGAGSEILADSELRTHKGRSLDEMLEDYRQENVVGRYIYQKVHVKINVSRRDVERYYYAHPAEFNPKPGRTIRLIWTGEDDADEIDRLLAAGTPFATVAARRINGNHPEDGGLLPPIEGELGIPPVNAAMIQLKQGQHSGRIVWDSRCYWVYIERISSGQPRTLREAQLEIEQKLRSQTSTREETAFRMELFQHWRDPEKAYGRRLPETISENPEDQMIETLVRIAMNRYAPPEP